jgi:hypothetical protein
LEGQQRIGVIAELSRVLREMGEDPARVIAGAGINPDMLRNPENSLTFVEVGRLIQACVTATGCEHFGFLVGQRSTTTSLGLVGRLMQNAPSGTRSWIYALIKDVMCVAPLRISLFRTRPHSWGTPLGSASLLHVC